MQIAHSSTLRDDSAIYFIRKGQVAVTFSKNSSPQTEQDQEQHRQQQHKALNQQQILEQQVQQMQQSFNLKGHPNIYSSFSLIPHQQNYNNSQQEIGGLVKQQQVLPNNSAHLLSKGETFGELSFFTGMHRQATITAVDFTTLVKIDRQEFIQLLKTSPLDYEKFCLIRDRITHREAYQDIGVRCFACKREDHLMESCPLVHVVAHKSTTLKKYQHDPGCVERSKYKRNMKDKFSSLKDREILDNAINRLGEDYPEIFEWENELESDEYQNDSYSDSASDSDVISEELEEDEDSKSNINDDNSSNKTIRNSFLASSPPKIVSSNHIQNKNNLQISIPKPLSTERLSCKIKIPKSRSVIFSKKSQILSPLSKINFQQKQDTTPINTSSSDSSFLEEPPKKYPSDKAIQKLSQDYFFQKLPKEINEQEEDIAEESDDSLPCPNELQNKNSKLYNQLLQKRGTLAQISERMEESTPHHSNQSYGNKGSILSSFPTFEIDKDDNNDNTSDQEVSDSNTLTQHIPQSNGVKFFPSLEIKDQIPSNVKSQFYEALLNRPSRSSFAFGAKHLPNASVNTSRKNSVYSKYRSPSVFQSRRVSLKVGNSFEGTKKRISQGDLSQKEIQSKRSSIYYNPESGFSPSSRRESMISLPRRRESALKIQFQPLLNRKSEMKANKQMNQQQSVLNSLINRLAEKFLNDSVIEQTVQVNRGSGLIDCEFEEMKEYSIYYPRHNYSAIIIKYQEIKLKQSLNGFIGAIKSGKMGESKGLELIHIDLDNSPKKRALNKYQTFSIIKSFQPLE